MRTVARTMADHLIAAAMLAMPALAQAHGGHGQAGAGHLHATDLWGLALALGLAAALWWARRR